MGQKVDGDRFKMLEDIKKKTRKIKLEEIWDPKNKAITFEVVAAQDFTKFEQIHISYGEKSNGFFLIEYGFAVEGNKYDFYRARVGPKSFGFGDLEEKIKLALEENHNMKSEI
jgi:hypothetical protein